MSPNETPTELDADAVSCQNTFCKAGIPIIAEVRGDAIMLCHYDYGILSGPELECIDRQMARVNYRSIAPMLYVQTELHRIISRAEKSKIKERLEEIRKEQIKGYVCQYTGQTK